MQLHFLGATGTVTGSKTLFKDGERATLIDCGLFQGIKPLRLRNWNPLPVSPRGIHSVVLTHAHIDHSGYLPVLVKNGFRGRIHCSHATHALCEILLLDAAHLEEEAARFANRFGFSRHRPALPLFTVEDARHALSLFRPVDYDTPIALSTVSSARLLPAGHILGAAMVLIEAHGRRILFSGDLGRLNDPVMRPPTPVKQADVLVLESTYGDRLHGTSDPEAELTAHLRRTFRRGGAVIIPAFAVGRAQLLLYYLSRLKASRAIPNVPIYLNSPMAIDATRIFRAFRREHRLTVDECSAMFQVAQFVNRPAESIALTERNGPMVVISASGMATGGRVLHHLKAMAPDSRNLILFAGFQAAGTRGAALVDGAREIKIHGEYIPVRAEVANLDSLSAHADWREIVTWLRHFRGPPSQVFLTHGEPVAADRMRVHLEEELGWDAAIPEYLDKVTLEP